MSTANLMRAASPQAELLGPDGLLDAGLVESCKEFVHNGSRATLDQERCAVALSLLGAGVSRRQIAERLGMSRNTLDAIEHLGERGGQLEPLKERVARELARLVGDAASEIRDTIHAGRRTVDAAAWLKAAATALGIGNQVHALATGSATEIVEHRVGPSREEQERWMRSVVDLVPVVSDVQSGVSGRFVVVLPLVSGVDTSDDTAGAGRTVRIEAGQVGAKGEGGGVAVPAGLESSDGFTSPKILVEGDNQ